MANDNIFFDEWRECLREHYKYVIKTNDTITRQSLTKILLGADVRFTEDDLQQLYIEATMHTDAYDSGDNIPDVAVVASDVAQASNDKTFQVHPAECNCDLCSPAQAHIDAALERGHDEDGQPLSKDMPIEEIKGVANGNVFVVAKSTVAEDSVDDLGIETVGSDDTEIMDDIDVDDTITDESDANTNDADAPDQNDPRQMSMF